ncbi:MAG: 2-C-methyl-D-erythritol 4-phosphate cytidylyltransferase [Pyrinomonadaceae bacterium]|nr:2-C-methyl-D-erythritol 4-phosphate cytidylyltransferase [Pyrinomonadaceae bacterium]
MNTAIIVAAGSGSRFGSAIPKQFAVLCGKPVIIHTIERFEACDAIDEIVLVLSESGIEQFQISNFRSEIKKLKKIVSGGASRTESVRNGLDAVDPSTEFVAVHDGARPLVTSREIARTVEKALESGAACLVAEVTDTIKKIDNGHIAGTVDRNSLRRALTPQAFRYDLLKRAFEGADLNDSVTDECYLVEKLGIKISIVEGSSRNIKITKPDDLLFAESVITAEAGY